MALVTGSIQYASADHSLGDQGIFKDENSVNLVSIKDSKYLIHLQVVVRDAQGQLVHVSETIHGNYIPHKITDFIFDEYLGKKEIVIINNIKYEKVQYTITHDVQQYSFTKSIHDMQSFWSILFSIKSNEHGNKQGVLLIPIFLSITPHISLEEDDVFTLHWTVLREF